MLNKAKSPNKEVQIPLKPIKQLVFAIYFLYQLIKPFRPKQHDPNKKKGANWHGANFYNRDNQKKYYTEKTHGK